MNKNLLLSDTAQIDTQPKLEIFADDVKCTHGAAVGRLDQAALFYLNSRGLGELEARELLVHGFVNEVLDSIDDDAIRQYADAAVAADLGELGGS
jgi:Fe-S cluster assembly protein SufD